ncbi:MAG: DUF2190 family protein [Sulfitobacter sp.]
MRNYIQSGGHLMITAVAALASGQGVLAGAIFGVAQEKVEIGEDVTIVRKGVFSLPKLAAQAWELGAKVYWDDENSRCTTVASGNTLIGAAADVAADPSDDGIVVLDGAIR